MKKILIVEDEAFISDIYKTSLSKAGFEVDAVINGDKAVEEAVAFQPDLIILDIILPGKNGFDVLRSLKQNEACKEMPVLIVSNLGQDSEVKLGAELGAIDYIIKANINIQDLIELIEKKVKELS
jgi:DNA-binding response OmpR family regulator